MNIQENILRIRQSLPSDVRLVAVSKTKPVSDLLEAYAAGQRIFGENYATELRDKHNLLPPDTEWHFIGHVQSKQLKYYIDFVSMIHGVDTWEHLSDIDHAARKAGRTVDVLLQLHVAEEETKFGFLPEELLDASIEPADYQSVRIRGLMAMATNTADTNRVRADFRRIREVFDTLKSTTFASHDEFRELSMGMSHDYPIAVEEGSTMVRIGSLIFGERMYNKIG